MPDDLGVVYTDKRLSDLEKLLRRVYSQASKDIDKKIEAFTKKSEAEEKRERAKLDAGKITQEEFDKWRKDNLFTGQKWNAQKADIAGVLANANNIANNMVRGEQYNVFGFNANYAAYQMEHGFGVNLDFSLYDKATVERLLRDNPNILPFKKLDKMKDARWNFKNMKSQITQGLLAGDSIPKIAQRLASVVPNRNEKQMILHARTAMTAAQNGGRMERYKEAQELGINFKKVWLATLDDRTRDEHAELDGQAVDPDEDFEVDGYRIAYPGDPHADPAMVYNCRCTLITKLVDYPSSFDRRGKNEDGEYENFGTMRYKEWEQAKKEKKESAHVVVQGKDISNTWHRRANEFDFEIDDVMNAQGFDGMPRIASADEFDELVKQANDGNGFIAQRTYSAPDQETLDAYREQLYNGKWYVDCSTGGAQYGQGMYCAADYNGELSTGIKMEMKHYKDLGESRYETYFDAGEARQRKYAMAEKEGDAIIASGGSNEEARRIYDSIMNMNDKEWAEKYAPELLPTKGVSYTETFTLDPTARIISYDDLFQMKVSYPEKIRDQYKIAYLEEHASVLGKEGIEFAKRNFGIDGYEFDWKRMNELHEKMSDEAKRIANAVANIHIPDEEVFKYNNMDLGAFAVLHGYDAINAVGHGASTSYTVILNRTKLIIKEP